MLMRGAQSHPAGCVFETPALKQFIFLPLQGNAFINLYKTHPDLFTAKEFESYK